MIARYKSIFKETIHIPSKHELFKMPLNKKTYEYLIKLAQSLNGGTTEEPNEYFRLFAELAGSVKEQLYQRNIKGMDKKTIEELYNTIEKVVGYGYRKDIKLLK
jgi:hypothetical protein